ncbi:Centrin-3 isoform 2 [Schistosoma japonicum]|uniref:Centrin-3 isoform 2 n=1 Tax=Schistosoma japonicum TaxID=6182 RepID=A0A4Z2DG47_SCHJA|nr:Centrin-3 isoform 2 [Schistosoma japonicum]
MSLVVVTLFAKSYVLMYSIQFISFLYVIFICVCFLVTDMILDRDPVTEMIRAFKLFDEDDSGKITYRNLKKVSKELGENLSDQELRAMIEEFDQDGDGARSSKNGCYLCIKY